VRLGLLELKAPFSFEAGKDRAFRELALATR
jgi:hypothetical protein